VSLVFELPLPANLNGSGWGGHYRKKTAGQEKYYTLLDTLVMAKRLPRAPAERWQQVTGECEVRTCPIMDQDNANRRMKWVWDWLQSRGYLTNDRNVRCVVVPVASKRKDQGITLVLREVSDAAP
jgi:hypothetical protein